MTACSLSNNGVRIFSNHSYADRIDCTWRLDPFLPEAKQTFRTATISLNVSDAPTAIKNGQHGLEGARTSSQNTGQTSNKAINFLDFVATQIYHGAGKENIWVQLVLPAEDGYIVRSDFLATRLVGCTLVAHTQGFTTPQQKVTGAAHLKDPDFATLLEHSVGGILASGDIQGTLDCVSERLQTELTLRLSLPWILPTPVTRKTLALIGSRPNFVLEPWLRAVRNIGIKLTVFGVDGSWLQEPESAGVVDLYVPVDMIVDSDLPSRIITAMRSVRRNFDGVTTFTDTLLFPVACVADTLNLPTSSPVSFAKATNKYATRVEVDGDECRALRVRGIDDLKNEMRKSRDSLQYPLIVKPCRGWNSEGVTKVANELQLFSAVSKLEAGSKEIDILIEEYVDGPEIDANFVLHDGEDLFCEINDGFPCTADSDGLDESANFMETDMLYPTSLNADERLMIRKSLHSKLLAMGFRTGVFHVEGRVRNSAYRYSTEDGMLDLRPKPFPPGNPSIFLLEVNARPPGMGALAATALIYGVDFAAIHMLCALGESESVRALSRPFATSTSTCGSGAQFWGDLLSIPTQSQGVYDGEDACKELGKRRPDLQGNIMWSMCCLRKGDYMPGPPFMVKVAYFLVFSRKSRQDVLHAAREIRNAIRIPLVDGDVSAQGPFGAVGAAIMAKRSCGLEKVSEMATKVA